MGKGKTPPMDIGKCRGQGDGLGAGDEESPVGKGEDACGGLDAERWGLHAVNGDVVVAVDNAYRINQG
jgi:hypothetical protein